MAAKTKDIGKKVTTSAEGDQLELFDRGSVTALSGVRVFDVGQGDCIGLLDQDDRVFCYIDYGGLTDHPDIDNPRNTPERLPVTYGKRRVSIVLTHWDKDHYWSASKKNPEAQQCEWLVPRQMASPQAVLFASGLPKARCWPEGRGTKPVRVGVGDLFDIEIRKCGPFSKRRRDEDRNKTGLAITLLQWRNENVAKFMLLPGDCPFHLIPERPAAPLCSLVAYHHGARSHWSKATKAAIQSPHQPRTMAYSFGRNEYGHPYRKNYRPNWDPFATTTAEARKGARLYIDLRWGK